MQSLFKDNKISWWGGSKPTGHVLSSQIACLNHLFPLRNDKDTVLKMLNGISDEFVDVMTIPTDRCPQAYIQFEAISNDDHLNEEANTRGSQCTSIDALIYAKHKSGKKWLILIEWKYTEHYGNDNKATGNKGIVRQRRYNKLIEKSKQLQSKNDLYYYEPFYQLMRQTLWAEQMIHHKDKEKIEADDYLHIHVIPSANKALLDKKYKATEEIGMEKSWRKMLSNQSKYVIIDPKQLLSGIKADPTYSDLYNYLSTRYY